MNPLSVSYRMICGVTHQFRNRMVTEKHLLITVNYFSLKRSIFNKLKIHFYKFHVIMLFYIHLSSCIDINRLHYVLRQSAEGFLSLEPITESKRLATSAPY